MKAFPRARAAVAGAAGALVLLLAAEAALRLLPVGGEGTDFVDGYGSAAPLRHAPSAELQFSRDWDMLYAHRDTVNALGFHGPCRQPAAPARQAWVLGDSFVAALMLDTSQTMANRLQDRLGPSWGVCAAGLAGAPGSEFLATLERWGGVRPGEAWVIVLNSGDIAESTDQQTGTGWHNLPAQVDAPLEGAPRPAPGRMLTLLRHSALYRYLSVNLGVAHTLQELRRTLDRFRPAVPTQASEDVGRDTARRRHQALAEQWAERLSRLARKAQAQPVVVINAFDPRRSTPAKSRQEQAQLDDIRAALAARGLPSVEVAPLMASEACRRQGSCYLFRDGHWSALGQDLIAQAVSQTLTTPPAVTEARVDGKR